jgi:DNA polymerase (family 10)
MTLPDNASLAERLEALAALYDLAGASTYSVRAYRRAAELIRATPAPVAELVRRGRVRELRGIGSSIEARLRELVETGALAEIEELEAEVQPELVGLARLAGLAPQRMVELGRALGVSTAEELRAAAAAGRLREVAGIGPATEAKVRAALERPPASPRRGLLLNRAWEVAGSIADALGGATAGDPRRFCDTSHRLAVVVAAAHPAPVLDRFAALPQVVAVVEREERRALGVTVDGVPVELVVAPPGRFGTELLRTTGSAAYVEALGDLPAGATEEEVYARLALPYLPPELREEPFRGAPPPLVERSDVRGDLHVHTRWSDGKASVLEMAEAAIALGYEYLAICDHTRNVRVVPGLDGDDVRRQGEEIAAVNERLAPFRVLRGSECDILDDGSLDLPDDVLAELDWVQASVHAGQRQSADRLTKRTLAAVEHPAVRSISHPQGRILNHRPPNAVDLEAVYAACAETGTALETNGLPDRIDLSSSLVRDAIRAGVRITCSTDAHSVRGLANMRLSVATARRGWATAADVLNTQPLELVVD